MKSTYCEISVVDTDEISFDFKKKVSQEIKSQKNLDAGWYFSLADNEKNKKFKFLYLEQEPKGVFKVNYQPHF